MENYICKTCGVQHGATDGPPANCIICDDERQFVGWAGQQWTTIEEMRAAGHKNELRELEPGLTGIGTQLSFAIGQRALLVQTPHGNMLWDCISYIDDDTVSRVNDLGGLHAISASHPHFYASMVEWSRAFGGAAIHVPEADKEWVMRPDPAVQLWKRSLEVLPGVTLIQCGGHFEGSAVLHWAEGAGGKGALLVGDTTAVVLDRRYVSFMRSYPNNIPLSASAIRQILEAVKPYPFDKIYGGWWGRDVAEGGEKALRESAERHIRYIQD